MAEGRVEGLVAAAREASSKVRLVAPRGSAGFSPARRGGTRIV